MATETDIKTVFTKKIGPLPAWGWAAGIGGVILGWKILHPSAASSSSTGLVPTNPPTTGTGAADTSSADQTLFQQLQDALTQATTQQTADESTIQQLQGSLAGVESGQAGLSGSIGALTSFQSLSQQLMDLINQRATALYQISHWQTFKSTHEAALARCTTSSCKSTNTSAIATANSNISSYTKQADSLSTQITSLQQQIAGLGVSS